MANRQMADRRAETEARHSVELENLGTELHALYKEKHAKKVEALKQTYQKQYERKIRILEDKIRNLEDEKGKLDGALAEERREKRTEGISQEECDELEQFHGFTIHNS